MSAEPYVIFSPEQFTVIMNDASDSMQFTFEMDGEPEPIKFVAYRTSDDGWSIWKSGTRNYFNSANEFMSSYKTFLKKITIHHHQ